MSGHVLEVQNLKTYFYTKHRETKAVDGVSFEVRSGEILAIVGESGSGKSVTSLSVMRLVPEPHGKIVEGSILLEGKDLLAVSEKEMTGIRGKDIAMVFQEPMTSLNPVFTIGNQIAEAMMKHQGLRKSDAYKRAVELLKLTGFPRPEETVHEYPHQLSGGMRQRAMIAMAISCNPKILIADEPTTALDVTIQAQILDLMKEIQQQTHSSIMLITHDLGVVAEMADRVIVMYGGQVIEESTVERIFEIPLHPYTKGLLASMPKMDEEVKRLEQIPGSVPPAHDFPQGCRFAPRCSHAMPQCTESIPTLTEVEVGHKVRCFLHETI